MPLGGTPPPDFFFPFPGFFSMKRSSRERRAEACCLRFASTATGFSFTRPAACFPAVCLPATYFPADFAGVSTLFGFTSVSAAFFAGAFLAARTVLFVVAFLTAGAAAFFEGAFFSGGTTAFLVAEAAFPFAELVGFSAGAAFGFFSPVSSVFGFRAAAGFAEGFFARSEALLPEADPEVLSPAARFAVLRGLSASAGFFFKLSDIYMIAPLFSVSTILPRSRSGMNLF